MPCRIKGGKREARWKVEACAVLAVGLCVPAVRVHASKSWARTPPTSLHLSPAGGGGSLGELLRRQLIRRYKPLYRRALELGTCSEQPLKQLPGRRVTAE